MGFGTDPGVYWTLDWSASILAQIDQQPLYNAVNWRFGAGSYPPGPHNSTASYTNLAFMHCPSDDNKSPSYPVGSKNYLAAVSGPSAIYCWTGIIVSMKPDATNYPGQENGYVNSYCGTFGFEGVTDGTSNTAMFGESLLGNGPPGSTITLATAQRKPVYYFLSPLSVQIDGGPSASGLALRFVQSCLALPGSTPGQGVGNPRTGNFWLSSNTWASLDWDSYNHWMPPNSFGCNNPANQVPSADYVNYYDAMPASSNHPGGVNLCMGDGHVQFIKNTIGLPTWWALATRSGGEVISSDQY